MVKFYNYKCIVFLKILKLIKLQIFDITIMFDFFI
jgi:hypothetical protein